jgi:hypothetical protein
MYKYRLDREQEAVPNHDNSDSLINASSQSNGKDVSKSNAKKALDERHNKVNPRNEDDVFNFEEMSVSKDDLKEICRANKYILKLTCDSGHTQFYGQKNVPGYTLMAMKCNDGLYSLARPCQVDEP